MLIRGLTLAPALLLATSAFAQTLPNLSDHPLPGNTGINAFSWVNPAGEVEIPDKIEITAKIQQAQDHLAASSTGIFRIQIPFSTWIAFAVDGRIERWHTNTAEGRLLLPDLNGRTDGGDVNFRTMIRVLRDNPKNYCPAITLKATTKTASGDFVTSRRYTDSAGYEIGIAASKAFRMDPQFINKLRFFPEVAFVAWDTKVGQQDDSYKFAGGFEVSTERHSFQVSFLGFNGWMDGSLDQVSSLNGQYRYHANQRLDFSLSGSAGLSEAANPWMLAAGIHCYLNRFSRKAQ